MNVENLSPNIGSAIRLDAQTLVSGIVAQDIRDILDDRLAISFPGVGLSTEQQVAFARTLGRIGNEERGGILSVSQNPEVNPDSVIADYQRASLTWHFDGYNGGIPDYATLLTARVLPESGGETEIANTVKAYLDLPEDERAFLDTLEVVHDTETAMRSANAWPSHAQLQTWQRSGQYVFPLVWRTKSGRKSLLLGHSASYVRGMSLPEGRALLCRLCEWATQPQYVYRHKWAEGDLLLWDNVGTLHRAAPYPADSRRLLLRTPLLGDGGWEGRTSFALSPAQSQI